MKGIVYQLKNIRRDKLCILSFILSVIAGLAVNLLSDVSFLTIGEASFGVVQDDMTEEMLYWLGMNGSITIYDGLEALYGAVNDPATQMIGVLREGDAIRTLLSGDELQLYKTVGDVLPQLYAERDLADAAIVDVRPMTSNHEWLKSLLIVITMVTAMFMGCTFNTMSIIGEKEDGIFLINEIMPMTQKEYLLQKIVLGFAGGMLSTAATALVCMRLGASQIIPLLLTIVLSAFISALTGLFIGRFSSGMMVGIVYIKFVMILFIAPPILFYLTIPADSIFHTISCLLPSGAAFYALMDLMNEQAHIGEYISVLLIHCIFWTLLYLRIGKNIWKAKG